VDSSEQARELRTARLVASSGIAASAVLAVVNIAAGILTQSTSVFAAGAEFAGDVMASTIVLFGLTVAARPADENHPYGHGRVETLAALTVGGILMLGGVAVSWHSLQAVGAVHPPPSQLAVAALIIAIAVRGGMAALKFRVGRRLQSASLVADAWNDTVDILAASTALTAVGLTMYDPVRFLAADHYGGFAVGIIVVLTGVRVARDASFDLIDTMPEPELLDDMRVIAATVPGVARVEKGFARKTGFRYHVDLHVEVDAALTVGAAHQIARAVRERLRSSLPWVADVLVHIEPADTRTTGSVATAGDNPETDARVDGTSKRG
jgi:cation diffusion facilitator family transporter